MALYSITRLKQVEAWNINALDKEQIQKYKLQV
jgi:hypothetical protein